MLNSKCFKSILYFFPSVKVPDDDSMKQGESSQNISFDIDEDTDTDIQVVNIKTPAACGNDNSNVSDVMHPNSCTTEVIVKKEITQEHLPSSRPKSSIADESSVVEKEIDTVDIVEQKMVRQQLTGNITQ